MSAFITNAEGFTVVYADGSCFSNGRYGAKAGIGVWFGDGNPYNVSEPVVGRATNNNAEIQAITAAANQAARANIRYLKIYTDSQFVIKCATEWMSKWKHYNWIRANGEPVINKEELIEMDYALQQLDKVYMEHVKGHQGSHGNQQADWLARAGANRYYQY